MPVQSKYDIGEKIYFLDGFKIKTGEVTSVRLEVAKNKRTALYQINQVFWVKEELTNISYKDLLNEIFHYNPID